MQIEMTPYLLCVTCFGRGFGTEELQVIPDMGYLDQFFETLMSQGRQLLGIGNEARGYHLFLHFFWDPDSPH